MVEYLQSPKGFKYRFLHPIRGAVNFSLIALPILAINVLQILSLAVKPISDSWFRRVNREFANFWWGMIVFLMERIYGMEMVFTGSKLPDRENAIVFSNHQGMIDIPALMPMAWRKGRLGDMKYFVKDVLKYFPGPGWGMVFLDCLFVKRDWYLDKDKIHKTFDKFKTNQIPIWLISFLEGTRVTNEKLDDSRIFASKKGMPLPMHVLIPRTKGFIGAINGLRNYVDAVYDFTIGYPGGVPSLWQLMKGHTRTFHLHVQRFPIAELPLSDDDLASWVLERYRIKDQLLAEFNRSTAFPGPRIVDPYRILN